MLKATTVLSALLAGLLINTSVWAQSASAPEATTAEEVTGPVDAQIGDEVPVIDRKAQSERDARRGIAIALRASILQGLGVEAIYSLSKHFNVRAQYNQFNFDKSLEEDGVDYDAKIKFRTAGVLLDYHPFAGSLRFTAGILNDGNKITASANCKTECDVGDLTIKASGGTSPNLSAGIDMSRGAAPYFGVGFGNAMKGWPVHFAYDIGVIAQGSPRVQLAASGTGDVTDNNTNMTRQNVNLGTDPQVQGEITKERQDLQETADKIKLFPAISITIGYRFHW